MTPPECPECGCYNTEVQATLGGGDTIEHVRTCAECPTQFTVIYDAVEKQTDYVGGTDE